MEVMGLEPTTSCLQSRCSSQLSYTPGARSKRELRAAAAEATIVGARPGTSTSGRGHRMPPVSVGSQQGSAGGRRPDRQPVAVHDRD